LKVIRNIFTDNYVIFLCRSTNKRDEVGGSGECRQSKHLYHKNKNGWDIQIITGAINFQKHGCWGWFVKVLENTVLHTWFLFLLETFWRQSFLLFLNLLHYFHKWRIIKKIRIKDLFKLKEKPIKNRLFFLCPQKAVSLVSLARSKLKKQTPLW